MNYLIIFISSIIIINAKIKVTLLQGIAAGAYGCGQVDVIPREEDFIERKTNTKCSKSVVKPTARKEECTMLNSVCLLSENIADRT